MNVKKVVLSVIMVFGLIGVLSIGAIFDYSSSPWLGVAVGIVLGINMSVVFDSVARQPVERQAVAAPQPIPLVQPPRPTQKQRYQPVVQEQEEETEYEEEDPKDDELEQLRKQLANLQKEKTELENKSKPAIVKRKPSVVLKRKPKVVAAPSSPEIFNEEDYPDDLR